MKALVLSGGSIKGAFQGGAIRWILEQGFRPDLIYGISVGALNGAFLAERTGRRVREGRPLDWSEIGEELEDLWIRKVTGPKCLIRQRGKIGLIASIAFNRFNGMTDTEPLRRMIHRELDPLNLAKSAVSFEAGAVNMFNGEIIYARHDQSDIRDYVYASTAIPIAMPLVEIFVGGERIPFYDGGVRDIAPLGRALQRAREAGETLSEIVVIVCQPDRITGGTFKRGKILSLSERLMDIVSSEIVENDLSFIRRMNRMLEVEKRDEVRIDGRIYRRIVPVLIRPDEEIALGIDKFDTRDIRRMFELGRKKAQACYPPKAREIP